MTAFRLFGYFSFMESFVLEQHVLFKVEYYPKIVPSISMPRVGLKIINIEFGK